MNIEYIIVGIISLISAICVSLLANYLQLYKWKTGEKKSVDSDSAESLSQAAAILIGPLKSEVEELRHENMTLKNSLKDMNDEWNMKFSSLQKDYVEMQRELSLFKNWAERLVFQVRSYGKEPVSFLPETDIPSSQNNSNNNNKNTNNYFTKE